MCVCVCVCVCARARARVCMCVHGVHAQHMHACSHQEFQKPQFSSWIMMVHQHHDWDHESSGGEPAWELTHRAECHEEQHMFVKHLLSIV